MRVLAKYQEDGGWKCIIRGIDGSECRTAIMARKDIETHLRIDHGVKEQHIMEDSRDIEDVSDLMVDMYRCGGVI